jgi:hypothetical protein
MRRFRIWFLSRVVGRRWEITVSGDIRGGMFDEERHRVLVRVHSLGCLGAGAI